MQFLLTPNYTFPFISNISYYQAVYLSVSQNSLSDAVSLPPGHPYSIIATIILTYAPHLQITQLKLMDEEKKNGAWLEKEPHEGVLMELCSCDSCAKYRESVIHFYVEECEYNILWMRLQQIIEKHYELIEE